jgi:hypothetical protein
MGGADSVALRWDQPRPRAAALTRGVYLPQRAGHHRAQRRATARELRPAHWPRPAVAAVARPQPTASLLQYCTFGLKLIAATLAAATVTLFLTNHDGAQSTNPVPPIATVQMPGAAHESSLYWRPPAPATDLVDSEPGRGVPANRSRRSRQRGRSRRRSSRWPHCRRPIQRSRPPRARQSPQRRPATNSPASRCAT